MPPLQKKYELSESLTAYLKWLTQVLTFSKSPQMASVGGKDSSPSQYSEIEGFPDSNQVWSNIKGEEHRHVKFV